LRVRRTLALLVLALLALCCTPSAAAPKAPSHEALASQLTAKTVALVAQLGGVTRVYCSGVWLTPSVFVTAHHCVEDEEDVLYAVRADVFDGPEERSSIVARTARVIAEDPDHDLALVQTEYPAPPHGVAKIGNAEVRQGAHAHVMGHSRRLYWSYSSGDVAAVRRINTGYVDCLMIQTTAPTSGGNSGGGLFDEAGALIGIAHASRSDGQNLNFYIHRAYVAALLRDTKL
jgi:S1-C subfamily serine protease